VECVIQSSKSRGTSLPRLLTCNEDAPVWLDAYGHAITQQHVDGVLGHLCPRAVLFFQPRPGRVETSPVRVPGREETRTMRGTLMENDRFCCGHHRRPNWKAAFLELLQSKMEGIIRVCPVGAMATNALSGLQSFNSLTHGTNRKWEGRCQKFKSLENATRRLL
jgi:hypothetical protein